MRFFDSHCHLEDRMVEEILKSDTKLVCNIGCDIKSAREAIEWTEKYDFVYGAVGIHPEFADTADDKVLGEITELAKKPKIVAIGEIGLDLHWEENPPKEAQIECFEKQIEIAQKGDGQ